MEETQHQEEGLENVVVVKQEVQDEKMGGEFYVIPEIKMESSEFVPNDSSNQYKEMLHIDEKPHKCDVCEKAFRTMSNMIRHYQKHTGERPHECVECGQAFAQKYSLQQHMIHRHSEEKRFQCEICDKLFKTKVN